MNGNATRSVNLTMLMIVSVCLPMVGALDAPAELDRAAERSQTHGGSTDPCLGHDACHGVDAGNSLDTSINLTDEFSWTGEETVTFYGNESDATGYSTSAAENQDQYIIDMPVGFGLSVTVHWNHSGGGFYEDRAYMVSLGPGDGSMTNYYTNDWGYNYYSTVGEIGISSAGGGLGGTYGAGIGTASYTGAPIDLAGDPAGILVWCYYCHNAAASPEYTMNISVWPSDSGHVGDHTEPQYNIILDMPDEPASWNSQSDTFTLDGTNSADLVVTYCDVWCTPETSIDVTKPDGTVDSWNPIPDYFTGWLATYSDAGTYTVDKTDTWGDGGMGLTVGILLGNFSGFLTATDFVFEDRATGYVDSTDTSDIYAVYIPENYAANLTLSWENSADLELNIYSSYDMTNGLSGLMAYSWFNQPEFVDLGQLGAATTVYVEVEHYAGPASGYILDLQTEPGAPPPCFFQDDGSAPGSGSFTGNGEDATEGSFSPDDLPVDVSGHTVYDGDGTWSGVFEGMVCAGYDEADWFALDVPAYHGAHLILDWHEGIDNNFNDTIEIEGELALYLYMVTSSGGTSTVYSAPYNTFETSPAAAATNESYSWTNDLDTDSTLYIRILLESMTEDYESNYTVSYSIYNASEEPAELACQNDAFMSQPGDCADGGDDTYGADALNISSANQSFTGYGHDEFDEYDHYRFWMPNNYLVTICVEFPEHNDVDVVLHYKNPLYTWMYTVDSEYYANPACVYSMFDDADQFLWLEVRTDTGSGHYTVTMEFMTPGMEPGANQDDCGLAGSVAGGDAPDAIYPGNWDGHAFLNDSTQGDFNPYDANGDVRSHWDGGICTGWLDKTWDSYDHYSIAVPQGHYMQVDFDLDMEDSGILETTYAGVWIYMCQIQHLPCGFGNLAYFVDDLAGTNIDEGSLNTGLFPVGVPHNASGTVGGVADTPGWAYMRVYQSSFSGVDNLTYELNITFHPLSELEGGNQNDANCGCDAGTGAGSAVIVNDHMNQTQADRLANDSVLGWHGWAHGDLDTTDVYLFTVPANHGVDLTWECNEWTNGNESCDAYHFMYQWQPDGTNSWIGSPMYASSFNYNTSTIASPQDQLWGIGIYNWFGVDDDGDAYAVNVTFYTLDADGDGWLDQLELDCGADPYDANSTPTDTDGDGICDFLDPDIDGDGTDNEFDEMPLDENGSADMDGDNIPDASDSDIDGDGWSNAAEQICFGLPTTADMDANTKPSDYDGDLLCDINRGLTWTADTDNDGEDDLAEPDWILMDTQTDVEDSLAYLYVDFDGDGDGVDDETDQFDFDECASDDTDRDGLPDSIDTTLLSDPSDANSTLLCVPETPTGLVEDTDDDGDTYNDTYEIDCGSDPLAANEMPIDSTLDMTLGGYSNGKCDALDPDDDNDGVNDTEDLWPLDHTEWADADADGQGDNRDMDDDNDGWWDSCELSAWQAAQDAAQVEGVNYFPNEANEIASNCPGHTDAFPLDSSEWEDTDGDLVGNNADLDDDGQGTVAEAPGNYDWTDAEEIACGSDPLDHTSVPLDNDNDYICDAMDDDDDNDGILDSLDAFPENNGESADNDGDGTGDESDDDDDNDGWSDEDEAACLPNTLDPHKDASIVPTDNDGDGECDPNDGDDDNDGVIDVDDAFPFNPLEREDSDGDGVGDNSDMDDDGDGWLDATEVACANAGGTGDKDVASETPEDLDGDGLCDAIDTDDDGDGYPDPACEESASKSEYVACAVGDEDRFPRDSAEWYDSNEDNLGDNANPITLVDKITYDPLPYLGIVAAIGALGYGLLQMNKGASRSDEDEAADYTEEFEDFDFEDDDEPVDDEDEQEED